MHWQLRDRCPLCFVAHSPGNLFAIFLWPQYLDLGFLDARRRWARSRPRGAGSAGGAASVNKPTMSKHSLQRRQFRAQPLQEPAAASSCIMQCTHDLSSFREWVAGANSEGPAMVGGGRSVNGGLGRSGIGNSDRRAHRAAHTAVEGESPGHGRPHGPQCGERAVLDSGDL